MTDAPLPFITVRFRANARPPARRLPLPFICGHRNLRRLWALNFTAAGP